MPSFSAHQVYQLTHGQSVSDLLYQLGMKKIYGDRGELEKVLGYNNLNLERSKTLGVGTPIKIPIELLSKYAPQNNPAVQSANSTEPTAKPVTTVGSVGQVGLGLLNYKGASARGERFSAVAPWFFLGASHEVRRAKWVTHFFGRLELTCIDCSNGSSFIPTFQFAAAEQFRVTDSFDVGIGAAADRDFFIIGDLTTYDVIAGYVPKAFLSVSKKCEKSRIRFDLGVAVASQLVDAYSSRTNPYGELEFAWVTSKNLRLGIVGSYEKRDLKNFEQDLRSVAVNVKFF